MNYRLLPVAGTSKPHRTTARGQIVVTLAREILDCQEAKSFPLASEHRLCRRFNVSRVTVRLALADLENRGLIYRKHGKGTFAPGSATRTHRHVGVLLKSRQPAESRVLVEILEGMKIVMTPLRSTIILIGMSPEEWGPELAAILGCVIVVAENATISDLDNLKDRKLPFLIVGETDLPGPRIPSQTVEHSFFEIGQRAAEALNRAAMTGEPVDRLVLEFFNGLELDDPESHQGTAG